MDVKQLKEMNIELLKSEKNIFHLYLSSRKIPFSKANKQILIGCLVVSVFISLGMPLEDLFKKIESLSSVLLGTVATVTGFLIAGYAIFCSVTAPKLSLLMYSNGTKKYGFSNLKYTHLIFIRVFIYYLFYTISIVLVTAFSGYKGYFFDLIIDTVEYNDLIFKAINVLVFNWVVVGFLFLLLQLGSFIFNIYHSIMTAIASYPYLDNFDVTFKSKKDDDL